MKLSVKAKEVGKELELRKKRSLNAKRLWQDSEHRKRVIERLSAIMKAKFLDPGYKEEFVRKMVEVMQIKPNGLEKAVCELLQSYFLNEWRYVGDGKVFIVGFVPDFIHKKENWIIEVNGDYWHNLPEVREKDKRKKEAYERCGYKVLEVWENEVRTSPVIVVSKVLDFFYGSV